MGFAAYRVQQLRQPIAGPFDELVATVLGGMQDQELALLRVAALARLPKTCPDDGTDLLLGWFGLDRYPGDTPDTIRARCGAAFPLYELGGSPQSMINAEVLFLVGADVRVLTEGYDGPIYEGSWYSRGRVILGPNFGASGIGPGELGAVTLGAWVLGSSMSVAQRSTLKRLAWRWKDAYGIIPDVYLVYPNAGTISATDGGTHTPGVGASVTLAITTDTADLLGAALSIGSPVAWVGVVTAIVDSFTITVLVTSSPTPGVTVPDEAPVALGCKGALLGVDSVLGSFLLAADGQTSTLTILPQFGSQTYLGTWVLGTPDLT